MLPYFPALRFKQGEYTACAKLPSAIQKYIFPRFIVPPPKERDPELARIPTPDEIAYLTGSRIGKHWPLHPAFLDAQYATPALEGDGLLRMFAVARSYNPNLIPVAQVSDLADPTYRKIIGATSPRFGIYMPYEDIDPDALISAVQNIGVSPQDCVIFVDFTGADLEPERAAGSIGFVFDLLGECAPWNRIVFQGSVFPTANPAEHGQSILIPRNEYKSFVAAREECSVSVDRIGYGDYAADCGEINFPTKSGGGKAIRHIRYTTPTDTFVVRGEKEGSDEQIIRDVCQKIIASPHYSGRDLSYADERIWQIAKGLASCGNASMWREWNTAHHLTLAVHDLGRKAGIEFTKEKVAAISEQVLMFED